MELSLHGIPVSQPYISARLVVLSLNFSFPLERVELVELVELVVLVVMVVMLLPVDREVYSGRVAEEQIDGRPI